MFNSPAGIAVDASHNIYVTDQYNHTIRKLTPGTDGWDRQHGGRGAAATRQR